MASITDNSQSGKTPSILLNRRRDMVKKMLVILSMILIGILIIVYKSNNEYWSNQFIAYNQYLFGISLVCIILVILMVVLDIKQILKHELLGSILFGIGTLIVSLYYARFYFSLDAMGSDGTPFIIVGAIIMSMGTLVFMRTGGYIGASLVGLINILLLSMVHMIDTRSIVQFDSEALQIINVTIVCFIVGFFLLVYHDIKFFYLAKLMLDENKFRRKKDYNKALNYCNKALNVYPYFATAWNNKGNVLFNMGKKKEAMDCYQKALTINPDYIPAKRNIQQMGRA